MDQQLINWLIAAFGGILGFILHAVWDAVKDLQKADKEMAEKVSNIEVLVAGNYVKKEEFDQSIQRLFEKLDHIDEKLDGKVDRKYNHQG